MINPKHKFALEVQCDQTLWQKDETRVRGAHGISEAACWGLFPRLRDRGEEQLGTRDRYTRTHTRDLSNKPLINREIKYQTRDSYKDWTISSVDIEPYKMRQWYSVS